MMLQSYTVFCHMYIMYFYSTHSINFGADTVLGAEDTDIFRNRYGSYYHETYSLSG